jgi:iron complex transport system ATP-binding protein
VIVSVENLSRSYGSRKAVSGVSFGVADREIFGVLGPNGGGKSTLFKTMLGLIPPQGGLVRLDGEIVTNLPRATFAKRVAYVPQSHAGYFPFPAIDVVTMGRTAHLSPFAGPSADDRARAHEALQRVNLARLAEQPYTQLSGGERQLVLIARALAQEAPLIVMDEPTASLDFGNQALVLREIGRLKAAGAGILLATHDPDQALLLADRVALLHEGRLVADAAPETAITPDNLRALYGVEVEVRQLSMARGRSRSVCVLAGH